MTTKMTERDKKLLMGLGIFCLVAILAAVVILPLYSANELMKEQIEANAEQIALMEQKQAELPILRAEREAKEKELLEVQEPLYPLMKTQDIDRLLTEKVMLYGMSAKRLQITMPEEAANVTGFGRSADDGSNPDKKDGVWIASVSLEVSGSMAAMDNLIDNLSLQTPGVRITGLTWSSARRQVDQTTGLSEPYDILSLRLEVEMSRKELGTDG